MIKIYLVICHGGNKNCWFTIIYIMTKRITVRPFVGYINSRHKLHEADCIFLLYSAISSLSICSGAKS